MNMERLLKNTSPSWLATEDIVMSTRIRLARNLKGLKFPICFSEEEAEEVEERVQQALLIEKNDLHAFMQVKMKDLPKLQRQVLVEKHLISPNLASQPKGAVFLTEDETLSVMVNEEDHIRIQCLAPAMNLQEAFERAKQLDEHLQQKLHYAYDERYGFLTSCPTNVGTGLRASVMLHLPALTMTKKINHVIQMITRLGMVVRGIYGEGSGNSGNIYQFSNQITLGKSSKEILQELEGIVQRVVAKEKEARKQLMTQAPLFLEDRVSRALGILCYAKVLTSDEAASCLSNVRLGVALELISNIVPSSLNECMLLMQPGFIQQYAGAMLQPTERDVYRAQLMQSKLTEQTKGEKGEGFNDV
ncbi:MAG: protein arginine kinase [Solibacillus sp.]